ncbi:uncharacterized protein OCT59_013890 [Rhizophagus irregularis]|uniref:uncharacterized protein n=1 Tax=Rhizophagus irregularis TaxID=588596 RepID=UPI0033222AF0|nr:hypothetical protein OCT59_013890 [Rhizophagus irregularis]
MRNNNQIKNKHTLKKTSIPKDPVLGLKQLQVWARLNGAEEEFTKIFLVILDHLKKETPFSKEAIPKGQIFK